MVFFQVLEVFLIIMLWKKKEGLCMLLSLGSVPVLQEVEHISLEEDDEVFIVLYDKRFYRPNSIKAYVLAYKTRNANYDNMIILHQRVHKKELIL